MRRLGRGRRAQIRGRRLRLTVFQVCGYRLSKHRPDRDPGHHGRVPADRRSLAQWYADAKRIGGEQRRSGLQEHRIPTLASHEGIGPKPDTSRRIVLIVFVVDRRNARSQPRAGDVEDVLGDAKL